MSRINYWLVLLCTLLIVGCESPSPPKVLVFSKTAGYRHASIEPAKRALIQLGADNGFVVDTTEDAKLIREETLQAYAAVIFLSTTGDVLDHYQEADLERYIQAGRGFVGIHAATDTENHWAWYNRLVGAYFASHPKIQEADVHLVDSTHQSTAHLPAIWTRTDEWYNFKKYQDSLNLLLWVDEDSYQGGKMEREHPIAWYHEYDGGRAWYTAMGHTEESYAEAEFMQHLLGGIQYAIGENKPYHWEGIHTERVPEADRFEKTMLIEGQLFEPTELTVLPNLDLIVVERRGGVLHYDADRKQIRKVAEIPVYHKAEVPHVNAEEGLMGIQAAPNFAETGHVYLFYSPADTSVNRLSRFVWQGDSLDLASETIVLQFHSDRNICCHTGGSIAFSGDGRYLYLSTGDNATPFDEKGERYQNKGFAPLDQRPGHEQYDARRTSGNTNDLRGKVLRLEVQADGSYRIPEGNLFPEGTPKTRPEIYVMGTRNPYRISIDSRRGHLYWGDVGPDAKGDEWELRGPRGYDEINQARSAGYFGWPLFVGNNFAYHEFDYSNGRSGGTFDPAAPRNTSRNNTGLEELPPAQPAFIWYPYAPSKDFPQLDEGGRNAMAGPVYYSEDYPEETRLPAYFAGNLIIYDWIRNWVKLVHLNEAGDFEKMDPFLADHDFNNVIDMEVGPDGRLYLLEYGSGWFSRNPDAGIARIDYLSGNRPPKINAVEVAATSGKLPFQVKATVDASDPEGETMTYHWQIGYETYTTTEPRLSITLDETGDYPLSCRVEDASGATRVSEQQLLYAGNEAPQINISVAGNPQMFFRGEPLTYEVQVTDEDTVDWSRLLVQPTYKSKGKPASGHLAGSGLQAGEDIIAQLDCASCHRNDTVSIGPSYVAIATRYATAPDAITYLGEKIIKGGGGAWGEQAMAPHPGLSTAEAQQIAEWILAKATTGQEVESLPAKGSFLTDAETRRAYLHLQASYTDVPAEGIKPLTTQVSRVLRDNHFNFEEIQQGEGVVRAVHNGRDTWAISNTRAWLRLDSVSLQRVGEWAVLLGWKGDISGEYLLELRQASPEGKVLASVTSTVASRRGRQQQKLVASVESAAAQAHNLYIVISGTEAVEPKQVIYLPGVQFYAEE